MRHLQNVTSTHARAGARTRIISRQTCLHTRASARIHTRDRTHARMHARTRCTIWRLASAERVLYQLVFAVEVSKLMMRNRDHACTPDTS